MKAVLDLGVDRAILGTAALKDPDMVSQLADGHGPERIMVALDVRRGDVTTEGWQRTLGKKALELGKLFMEKGAGTIPSPISMWRASRRESTLSPPAILCGR